MGSDVSCMRGKFFPRQHTLAEYAAALVFLGAGLPLFRWLAQASVDFLGMAHFGLGRAGAGDGYALLISLGALTPPVLLAMYRTSPVLSARLREAARAALVTLFFHTLGFLVLGAWIRLGAGSLSMALLPRVLDQAGIPVMCLLAWVSFRLGLRFMRLSL